MRSDPLIRSQYAVLKRTARISLMRALSITFLLAALLHAHSHVLNASSLPQSFEKLNRMLRSYQVLDLDLDQISVEAKSEGRISIVLDNVPTELVLRAKNLRAPDIQWTQTTATGVVQETLPPVSTFEGEVAGEPDSQVRLLVRPDLFIGFIRRGNDWIFVEPLSLYVQGSSPKQSVTYHEADIRPEYPGVCGTTLLEDIGGHLFGIREGAAKSDVKEAALKHFRIATDADYEFYQVNGSSSNSVIEGVLNEVDGIYQSQLNLTLTVGFQNVFTSAAAQPYTLLDPGPLLGQVKSEWGAHRAGVQRDVVHMYSGKDLTGNVVGIAYLGVTCNLSYGYGLTSGSAFLGKLSAHEIGHNFNAQHDDQVTPPAAVCSGSGPIMCSSIQNHGPDEFSQRSKDDIGAYAATASCLTSVNTASVTTEAASGVSSSSASLNATVNPNGLSTSVRFQWGLTTSYGNTTPTQSLGGGASNITFNTALTALSPNTTYHFRTVATNSAGTAYGNDTIFVTKPVGSNTHLLLSVGSVKTSSTTGNGGTVQAGYATVELNSGSMPYGTAVFGVSKNGFVVSEAGVPASPPTTRARIFIESRPSVAGKSDREAAGTIAINTGFAMVNQGSAMATITFQLRDSAANNLAVGHGSLPPNSHVARFIDELQQMAPDFILPPNFTASTGYGSLEITSDQPLSIVALRLVANQRGETLLTTTPLADLQRAPGAGPLYFPQLVDGGGYQTSLVLLNTSSAWENGSIQILDNSGAPLAVHLSGDPGGAWPQFRYSIPPGGFYTLQTDGAPPGVKTGSVQVTPDTFNQAPIGAGVFTYTTGGIRVTESGIPSATSTTHARIYVDLSGGHNTGIAIAAPDGRPLHLTFNAFQTDGVTPAGSGSLDLTGNGHGASFANELIRSLPDGFTGVLDISAPTPFVALTLRSLKNGRGDFLITTFPVADFNQPAPAPVVFPQIVDGGEYKTQFILLNTTGAASDTTLTLFGDNGSMFSLGKK